MNLRNPLIVANWKMNKTVGESVEFARAFTPLTAQIRDVDIVICPPFTSFSVLQEMWAGKKIIMGAQNMFWAEKGAYTGEISGTMLLSAGCRYVIIGHSERRQLLGESDTIINRKLGAALTAGLIPILCVGETLQERENDRALQVIKEQLTKGLKDLPLPSSEWAVAYEPVWAIGTGINANPDDAQEMAAYIRGWLEKLYHKELAVSTRILYGGSVNEENVAGFFAKEDIDGALVGGASLKAQSFADIVRLAVK